MQQFWLTIYTINDKGETIQRTATLDDPLRKNLYEAFGLVNYAATRTFAGLMDELMESDRGVK